MAAVHQSMQQGIQAIQAGNSAEGERLLRYALKDPALKGRLRATALNWLGEVVSDRDEKIRCFEEALDADPNNDFAEERLAELLRPPKPKPAVPPPPDTLPGDTGRTVPPPPTLPGQTSALVAPPPPAPVYMPPGANRPAAPQAVPDTLPQAGVRDYTIVGILNGPNGRGSGFFVSTEGILATTRHVTGDQETVMVEFEPGRQQIAQVVRAFPEFDVALLKVEQTVRSLLTPSSFDDIPDNALLTIMAYGQPHSGGRKRETGRALASHLFPTDITQVPDAGGGPVLNDRQNVVGMITRNISSSSAYVYGVQIAAVLRCLEIYRSELRSAPNRIYCSGCGYASAAAAMGGFYCEACGTVMRHAREITRAQTPGMASLYGDSTQPACVHCGARAGFYNGLCLRCGLAGDPR